VTTVRLYTAEMKYKGHSRSLTVVLFRMLHLSGFLAARWTCVSRSRWTGAGRTGGNTRWWSWPCPASSASETQVSSCIHSNTFLTSSTDTNRSLVYLNTAQLNRESRNVPSSSTKTS